uniref:Uncharacterized protein n=1 Tax=Pleurozia purpurea TaxID=280637 RepID=D0R044_9MARC|nr:hypothetical protein PlpuMp45 [Pleurozia purpurea]ACR19381.1 hypothetical protein PlpuMp45 [Pleurozia purpurea]
MGRTDLVIFYAAGNFPPFLPFRLLKSLILNFALYKTKILYKRYAPFGREGIERALTQEVMYSREAHFRYLFAHNRYVDTRRGGAYSITCRTCRKRLNMRRVADLSFSCSAYAAQSGRPGAATQLIKHQARSGLNLPSPSDFVNNII